MQVVIEVIVFPKSFPRVKIGDTASACTGGAQCDHLSKGKWNSILDKVKQEKAANESECNKISESQKTCLKECEDNRLFWSLEFGC